MKPKEFQISLILVLSLLSKYHTYVCPLYYQYIPVLYNGFHDLLWFYLDQFTTFLHDSVNSIISIMTNIYFLITTKKLREIIPSLVHRFNTL